MDDESKKIILARRARFVAAALASVGIAQACEGSGPEPCLSFAVGGTEASGGESGSGTGGFSGTINPDGGFPDDGGDGEGGGGGGGGAPEPCLTVPKQVPT